jgi:hypothetical protein
VFSSSRLPPHRLPRRRPREAPPSRGGTCPPAPAASPDGGRSRSASAAFLRVAAPARSARLSPPAGGSPSPGRARAGPRLAGGHGPAPGPPPAGGATSLCHGCARARLETRRLSAAAPAAQRRASFRRADARAGCTPACRDLPSPSSPRFGAPMAPSFLRLCSATLGPKPSSCSPSMASPLRAPPSTSAFPLLFPALGQGAPRFGDLPTPWTQGPPSSSIQRPLISPSRWTSPPHGRPRPFPAARRRGRPFPHVGQPLPFPGCTHAASLAVGAPPSPASQAAPPDPRAPVSASLDPRACRRAPAFSP